MGGSYDHQRLQQAAEKLERASEGIMNVGRQLPNHVQAGPYAEHCAAILKALLEASTEMAVRLKVAADGVRQTEWTVDMIEQLNEDDAERIDVETEGGPGR